MRSTRVLRNGTASSTHPANSGSSSQRAASSSTICCRRSPLSSISSQGITTTPFARVEVEGAGALQEEAGELAGEGAGRARGRRASSSSRRIPTSVVLEKTSSMPGSRAQASTSSQSLARGDRPAHRGDEPRAPASPPRPRRPGRGGCRVRPAPRAPGRGRCRWSRPSRGGRRSVPARFAWSTKYSTKPRRKAPVPNCTPFSGSVEQAPAAGPPGAAPRLGGRGRAAGRAWGVVIASGGSERDAVLPDGDLAVVVTSRCWCALAPGATSRMQREERHPPAAPSSRCRRAARRR